MKVGGRRVEAVKKKEKKKNYEGAIFTWLLLRDGEKSCERLYVCMYTSQRGYQEEARKRPEIVRRS